MTFRPRNHIEDDIHNLIFTAMTDADGRKPDLEKVSQAVHALYRTLKWDHGADIYVLKNTRPIYDAIVDRATLSAESVAASWDGWEHDDRTIAVHVDLMIHVLNTTVLPLCTDYEPIPQRIG